MWRPCRFRKHSSTRCPTIPYLNHNFAAAKALTRQSKTTWEIPRWQQHWGYPPAALFGFCVALASGNVYAGVKGALCTAPLGLDTKRGMESWGERMAIARFRKTEDGLPAPSFGFPSWGYTLRGQE